MLLLYCDACTWRPDQEHFALTSDAVFLFVQLLIVLDAMSNV